MKFGQFVVFQSSKGHQGGLRRAELMAISIAKSILLLSVFVGPQVQADTSAAVQARQKLASINVDYSASSLMRAIAIGDDLVAELLLDAGIDPNFRAPLAGPLTEFAAIGASGEARAATLGATRLNTRDYARRLPAEAQVRYGPVAWLSQLEGSPLILASALCRSEIVTMLVAVHANLRDGGRWPEGTAHVSRNGPPPIEVAVGAVCKPAVQTLIAAGVRGDEGPPGGRTYAQEGLLSAGNVLGNATKRGSDQQRKDIVWIIDALEKVGLPPRAVQVFRERYSGS